LSKVQFKKGIQSAELEEMLRTVQVRIHSPQIAIEAFMRGIKGDPSSVSHGTTFEFNCRTDWV